MFTNDSILVDYVNAYKLLEEIKSNSLSDLLKKAAKVFVTLGKVINNLTETSNPVLIVLTMIYTLTFYPDPDNSKCIC